MQLFSTLHTRDVASVVTALRGLGLPDRTLAASISGIINQRLMRRLCENCRRADEMTSEARAMFEKHSLDVPDQLYRPHGCTACRKSGYFGRIGVFEAVALDSETRSAITSGVTEAELRAKLADQGMVSLNADALSKVAQGITDLDEALRIRWLT